MAAWTVRLARQAEQDIADILAWTEEHFGSRQAGVYAETLTLALEALTDGPGASGAKGRDDILPGIRTLHVARRGRHGRHFVVFRTSEDCCIDVLRILHDSMDLTRHVEI
ncbi:MAG: type II toxin-antitoxin system RelE/ParE family toxin [Rhodocyclaceae bacterium]|nr:type II toxin-antitoxin system RelE/ParE family toxin [Rhodocyclaceae bacterium]